MSTLKPQVIEDGYLKRWIKLTLELWLQEPWLFGINFLIILGLMILSLNDYTAIFLGVLILNFLLIELKLLEHHNFSIANFINLFKKSFQDIIFSIITIISAFSIFDIFTDFMYKHSLQVTHHVDIFHKFFGKTPGITENHIFSNIVGFNIVISVIYFIVYLYLTELVGFTILQNFMAAIDAFLLNFKQSATYFIFSIFTTLILANLIFFIHSFVNINTCLMIISILESFLSIIIVTFGYLYARESFEGPLKRKVTAKNKTRTMMGKSSPNLV